MQKMERLIKIKSILFFFLILNTYALLAQEIVEWKEVYNTDHNDLTYKISNDKIFTGTVQWKRKNGYLEYEEEYKNGIILSSNSYYRGKHNIISNKTIYHSNNPSIILKEHKYNLKNEIFETITYNDDGLRILIEQFNNRKLIYSCQYLGKKKHGLELCYGEDGKKMNYQCKFINGKKVKRVPVIPENAFLAGKEDKLNWFLIDSINNHKNNAQISIYDYNTGELIINKRFLKICPIDEMKFIEDLKEEIDFYDGEKIQLKDNCYLQAN